MANVLLQWAILQWQFPNATIVASTFDAYVDQLQTVAASLPVFTQEVGDVWITSTTADPVKMMWNRIASREYAACVVAGQCSSGDPRLQQFLFYLAKLPEHTVRRPRGCGWGWGCGSVCVSWRSCE